MVRGTVQRQAGFSLIELVVVFVLLAVLAAVAALNWRTTGENTVGYQVDLLARNLRHVQGLAATQGRTLRFNVASTQYCVTLPPATTCATPIIDPATGKPFIVVLSHGVTLTVVPSTDFDSLGRPKDVGGLLTASRTFKLQAEVTAWSALLRPLTGFVQVTSP